MLSEEEKNKVRAEETYRMEVRQQLEASEPQKKRNKIIGFLNSNFGSFLLSTVIVGGISFLYTNHQEELRKMEEARLQAQANLLIQDRLQTELYHRLNTISTITDTLAEYQSKDIYLAYHGASVGNDPLIKASFYNFKSHYLEYSTWSIIRLISELQKYDSSPSLERLKSLFQKINSLIVDYGQEWFYVTSKNKALPKRVKILERRLPPDGRPAYTYNIEGTEYILQPKDAPWRKVWHLDRTETIDELMEVIRDFSS